MTKREIAREIAGYMNYVQTRAGRPYNPMNVERTTNALTKGMTRDELTIVLNGWLSRNAQQLF